MTAEGEMKYLDIHFLDVGHGDCTIIDFPNRLTVVDINNCKAFDKEMEDEFEHRYKPQFANPLLTTPSPSPHLPSYAGTLAGLRSPTTLSQLLSQKTEAQRKLQEAKDKLTNPIDYLKAHFTGRPIFRYIQTHPDMDHMAGLYKIWVEEGIQIFNFWDTSHCIVKEDFALRTGAVNHDIRDWQTYLKLRNSKDTPRVLRPIIGTRADFYQQDGIHIWAPFDYRHKDDTDADPNDLSYILCVSIGQCNVLLGGDAPIATWQELLPRCNGKLPKIHLLKASHHGRKSGYDRDAVKAMNPDYTILSVGELKGKHDASASYEQFSNVGCFSTVEHGNIIARCWENGSVDLYDQDIVQIA
jgi:beta-lactamase superfamily II metal-dependent hydrolase